MERANVVGISLDGNCSEINDNIEVIIIMEESRLSSFAKHNPKVFLPPNIAIEIDDHLVDETSIVVRSGVNKDELEEQLMDVASNVDEEPQWIEVSRSRKKNKRSQTYLQPRARTRKKKTTLGPNRVRC